MTLGACGHENSPKARFCATCGASLVAAPLTVTSSDVGPDPETARTTRVKPSTSRRHRVPIILTAVGLVIALGAATFAVVTVLTKDDSASAEVYLEASGSRGAEPFTPDVSGTAVTLQDRFTTSGTPSSHGPVVATVKGNEPGLYGGTNDNAACDKETLKTFLAQHPDKATAWAGVIGIAPKTIGTYIDGLTPLVLRADTRVTNHGFRDGKATSRQAVLQAGTAVMVDARGVPRVRCSCGNPLGEPEAVDPTYTGTEWPGFDQDSVVAVAPASGSDTFTVRNLSGDGNLVIPVGSGDTGVLALGSDDGLYLWKDGKEQGHALGGQNVIMLTMSPDKSRLAIISSAPDDGLNAYHLSTLDRDGNITEISHDVDATRTLGWTDNDHVAFTALEGETGDELDAQVIEVKAGAQPSWPSSLSPTSNLEVSSAGRYGLTSVYENEKPTLRWIDFATGTEAPTGLDLSDCGNGGPGSCGDFSFSPDGRRVLLVTPEGISVADAGGAFVHKTGDRDSRAFWWDNDSIIDGSSSTAGDSTLIYDLDTGATRGATPGTAFGRVGDNLFMESPVNAAEVNSYFLVDPTTGARRDLTGADFSHREVSLSNGPGIVATAGTVAMIRIPFNDQDSDLYLVDEPTATIKSLSTSQGGPLPEVWAAALSPAASFSTAAAASGATSADFSRFAGEWTAHVSGITVDASGNVTMTWFFNDPSTDPPASGDVNLRLKIIRASGETATARVVARTDPEGYQPDFGPGAGPSVQVGDTYTFTLQSPGVVGEDALQWCDDSHSGQCGA